jgi:DNA-directed RNA polymerase specialized sigma24 family protein
VIGWKDREIAAYMHLAPSSVRVYLKQAREALGLRKGRRLYEDDINE